MTYLTFTAGHSWVGRLANALKPILLVNTLTAILTRLRQAFVDIRFTPHSCKTSFTGTSKHFFTVDTCCVVLTRIPGTFVDIYLALLSRVPRLAWTPISLGQTRTRGMIATRGRGAMINLHFTKFPAITRRTLTKEVWWLYNACGAILTNACATNLRRNVAMQTAVSWSADALVPIYLPFKKIKVIIVEGEMDGIIIMSLVWEINLALNPLAQSGYSTESCIIRPVTESIFIFSSLFNSFIMHKRYL